jgi:hypothetical protein
VVVLGRREHHAPLERGAFAEQFDRIASTTPLVDPV